MKKNIVLIVGAGASHDFDPRMGLGSHLVKDICDRVYEEKGKEYLSLVLNSLNYEDGVRKKFQNDLKEFIAQKEKENKIPSIDDFLNNHKEKKEYQGIGKFMIAAHILGYEQECLKNASFNKKSWIDELLKIIDNHQIIQELVSDEFQFDIITFNYDRLIEEFIFRRFGQKAETFVNNHVLHFYGQLSYLPWQHQYLAEIADENRILISLGKHEEVKELPFIDFGHPNYDYKRIKEKGKELLLIYDTERTCSPQILKANRIISEAHSILFLGFAYDKLNMEKLGIANMQTGIKKEKNWITNHYIGNYTNDIVSKFKKESKEISEKYFLGRNKTLSESCTDFIRIGLKKIFEGDK